jgi:nitroimidazol reductase NimA-like FMN-containing flavoprotein (pyridoxamine 5'-phosphate oxidase superfamily)
METYRNGLEVLNRDECLRLLRNGAVGRIGVSSAALPVVVPVTYALSGDTIVLRTPRDSRLAAATSNAVVAFEVDDLDQRGDGWSVLVTGIANEVTDPDEWVRCRELLLRPWGPGRDERFVRISTDIVSGRRTAPPCRAASA